MALTLAQFRSGFDPQTAKNSAFSLCLCTEDPEAVPSNPSPRPGVPGFLSGIQLEVLSLSLLLLLIIQGKQ